MATGVSIFKACGCVSITAVAQEKYVWVPTGHGVPLLCDVRGLHSPP
jgi:hypothetical protein